MLRGRDHLQEARLAARDAQAGQLWRCLPRGQRGAGSGGTLLLGSCAAVTAGRLQLALAGRPTKAAAGAAAGNRCPACSVRDTLLLLLPLLLLPWRGLLRAVVGIGNRGASFALLRAVAGIGMSRGEFVALLPPLLLMLPPLALWAELRLERLQALHCLSRERLLHHLCQAAMAAAAAAAGCSSRRGGARGDAQQLQVCHCRI